MKKFIAVIAAVCCCGGMFPAAAVAQDQPSVFNYGLRGMLIGTVAGASAGYVRYIDENDSSAIGRSAAYGALVGAGLGIIGGISDMVSAEKGLGDKILNDAALGGWFGMALGGVVGGIAALNTDDTSPIGKNAAWGYLAGVVMGTGIAVYQFNRGVSSASNANLTPSVAFVTDSHDQTCPIYGVNYNF